MSYHSTYPFSLDNEVVPQVHDELEAMFRKNEDMTSFSIMTPMDNLFWQVREVLTGWEKQGRPPFDEWLDFQFSDMNKDDSIEMQQWLRLRTIIIEARKRRYADA